MPNSQLIRLQEEYEQTLALLKSPRVGGQTRLVLEPLSEDLAKQISHEEINRPEEGE